MRSESGDDEQALRSAQGISGEQIRCPEDRRQFPALREQYAITKYSMSIFTNQARFTQGNNQIHP
jgi:hypothetical protein